MGTRTEVIVGATAADLSMRALGVVRLSMPVPIAATGGEVNVYLLDNADGSLTMFDTGLGNDDAVQALLGGISAAGRRVEAVTRIIISHGHPDHFGAARLIHERTGAPVLVHAQDASKIVAGGGGPQQAMALGRYLLQLGAPRDALERMGERYKRVANAARRLDEVTVLNEGEELEFRAFRATVVNTPGHTPGHIVLHAPGPKVLFGADHLLGRISPCPLIELGPDGDKSFRALVSYLESVRRMEELELDWVLPGHGEPFTDHRRVIAGLRAFYEKRQARLLGELGAGPLTPHEIAVTEFGTGRDDELFLIMSEIIGNLEVLEDNGSIEPVAGSMPRRYRRTDEKQG